MNGPSPRDEADGTVVFESTAMAQARMYTTLRILNRIQESGF
jgi:hypothetical protein